jgi:hypothetical protein
MSANLWKEVLQCTTTANIGIAKMVVVTGFVATSPSMSQATATNDIPVAQGGMQPGALRSSDPKLDQASLESQSPGSQCWAPNYGALPLERPPTDAERRGQKCWKTEANAPCGSWLVRFPLEDGPIDVQVNVECFSVEADPSGRVKQGSGCGPSAMIKHNTRYIHSPSTVTEEGQLSMRDCNLYPSLSPTVFMPYVMWPGTATSAMVGAWRAEAHRYRTHELGHLGIYVETLARMLGEVNANDCPTAEAFQTALAEAVHERQRRFDATEQLQAFGQPFDTGAPRFEILALTPAGAAATAPDCGAFSSPMPAASEPELRFLIDD